MTWMARLAALLSRPFAPLARRSRTNLPAGSLEAPDLAPRSGSEPPPLTSVEGGPPDTPADRPEVHVPRATLPVMAPAEVRPPRIPVTPVEPIGPAMTASPSTTMTLRIGNASVEISVTGDSSLTERVREPAVETPTAPADDALAAYEPDSWELLADAMATIARACDAAHRSGVPSGTSAALRAMNIDAGAHVRGLEADRLRVASHLYRNASDACRLVNDALLRRLEVGLADVLRVAAFAKSQLRGFIHENALFAVCPLQKRMHDEIAEMCRTHHVFLDRHMRLGDDAPWREHDRVASEIRRCRTGRTRKDEEREHTLRKLAYDLRQLEEWPDHAEHLLDAIDGSCRTLLRGGLDACDRRFRSLAELAEHSGVDAESHSSIWRIIEAQLEEQPDDVDHESVRHARPLLAGRRMAIVCGESRPIHGERIRQALGLASVDWIDHAHGASFRTISDRVLRADVLVIATGFTSHEMARELPALCKKAGIPVVRLWRGYSPSRIAHEMLRQVGDGLQTVEQVG